MAKNITPLLWISTILLSLLFVINFATAQTANHTPQEEQLKGRPIKTSPAYTLVAFNRESREMPYRVAAKNTTTSAKDQSSAASDNILLLYSLLVGGFLFLQRSAFNLSR